MREYGQVQSAFWVDHQGKTWRVPTTKYRLNFKNSAHAAIRAFVFRRDRFRCRVCGVKAVDVPKGYTGRFTLVAESSKDFHLDHIFPFVAGGRPHPSNMQMLCESCNCRKCGKVKS